MTASTAAGLEATVARAALPGPTSPIVSVLSLHENKQKLNPSVKKNKNKTPPIHTSITLRSHYMTFVLSKGNKTKSNLGQLGDFGELYNN